MTISNRPRKVSVHLSNRTRKEGGNSLRAIWPIFTPFGQQFSVTCTAINLASHAPGVCAEANLKESTARRMTLRSQIFENFVISLPLSAQLQPPL